MTDRQIELVQTTFADVEPIADQAAALFYGRLFELAPGVRSLFADDMTEQGRKLMDTLGVAASGLTDLEALVPVVQGLGERHAGYGALPEHFPVVGEALLWTLGQGLGEAFTDEAEAAWTAAYGLLSEVMVASVETATT
ncbi:MAG: globin family protein [Actinomycetota bacterium]